MNESTVPQVMVAARKIEGLWQAVLLIRGEFNRTFIGTDVSKVLHDALGFFTSPEYPDDTRVQVVLNLSIPEVDPPMIASV